jgi:hypothetical protein
MLPVVNYVASCFVNKRVRPTAGVLSLFKKQHLPPFGGKFNGSTQAAQSAADNNRIEFLLLRHETTIRKRVELIRREWTSSMLETDNESSTCSWRMKSFSSCV